ncbi:MAG: low molecular weight protein arginine phosphatase, partial [Phycisphaerae bacterium]|nr:low molecular weight protein arginine phosphatase [Phycisphaerae bacterium]
VCSGNTCRSPMAEAIARKIIADRMNVSPDRLLEQCGISVLSAGSFAMTGSPATPQGVAALQSLGIDLSHHRSQLLTVGLINQADVIFAMGQDHRSAVLALVPSAADKTMTLDPRGDIDDPIGGNVTLYRELAGALEKMITERLNDTIWADEAVRENRR